MKNSTILIVVAVCLIVAGIAVAGAAFTMTDFSFDGFSTEEFEEVTYTARGDFDHIMIATDIHDVTLALSDDSTCRIVGSESRNIAIEYEIEGTMLVVRTIDERKWYDHIGIFYGGAEMTLYLPKDTYISLTVAANTGDVLVPECFTFTGAAIAIDTGDIEVRAKVTGELGLAAGTGSITVSGVEPTKLDVSVTTGRTMLENIKTDGAITLECSTGRTELHSIEAGAIRSNGDTGSLLLKNVYVEREIGIERGTGDVTLTSVIAGEFDIETSTGDVELNLSDAESIEIETDTGRVDAVLLSEKFFQCESSTGSVKIPDTRSGGICKVTTTTGNIHITID